MSGRRVVITGIGAVTPIGTGVEGLWSGVLANRSAVRAIDRFDASSFPSRIAAQIDDFDPASHLDARRARRLDRFSALSVTAARLAVEHARVPFDNGVGARTGVWIGSALGGVAYGEEQHAGYVARGTRGVWPEHPSAQPTELRAAGREHPARVDGRAITHRRCGGGPRSSVPRRRSPQEHGVGRAGGTGARSGRRR